MAQLFFRFVTVRTKSKFQILKSRREMVATLVNLSSGTCTVTACPELGKLLQHDFTLT